MKSLPRGLFTQCVVFAVLVGILVLHSRVGTVTLSKTTFRLIILAVFVSFKNTGQPTH